MFSLAAWSLKNNRLIYALVVVIVVSGFVSFSTHPSREDPKITIRTALVTASLPGMSPQRVEDLITRKLEEKIREITAVDTIESISQLGKSTIRVELHDQFFDLAPIWQDLRNKMEAVKRQLPQGVQGPYVNDTYGEVAMATVALTGDGFRMAELRNEARDIRNKLYSVSGVSKVDLFGVEPERIYVELNNVRLAQFGLSSADVIQAVAETNIIAPGGRIEAGPVSLSIEPTGNFESLEDLKQISIQLPQTDGQFVYLEDLANIRRAYIDPPQSPVFYNGKPAVVVSVQMVDHYDSAQFGVALKNKLEAIQNELPIGYELEPITFQPNEIRMAVESVTNNLYQTIGIVLLVVMAFLGWRTGLIVGSMVPLTMLLSLLVMRILGIELERMSLAALIISLGLLVDNGIVIAEEIGTRIQGGEDRRVAVVQTGKLMAIPLLSSSLTTILAFLPLMLAANEAGEYTRSLSLVIAIALLASWCLAMTVTPLICYSGLKLQQGQAAQASPYDTRFYRAYSRGLSWILRHKFFSLSAIFAALIVALWGMKYVSKTFFPASERTQIQVYLDLPVGSNTYATIQATRQLAEWLVDEDDNPEITSHVAYIAGGGPRFYMGLNPIDPDNHRAFFVVNVDSTKHVPPLIQRIAAYATENIPEVRVTVKPMSMGGTESGLVEYRIIGEDANTLADLAKQLKQNLRQIDGAINIKDNWENRIFKLIVDIDQARARRAELSSESVAHALDSILSGTTATDYREGDTLVPIVFRAEEEERTNVDRLRTLTISKDDGIPIPLMQIADFDGEPEFAMIQRKDMERVITVSVKHLSLSAIELDALAAPYLKNLPLQKGYRLEKGGELEASGDAQGALFANMPMAFCLIILILIAQFNSLRKALIILSVIPLTLVGVTIALLVMPGANLSFIGILGLLSLAGIIINNAIVLIDRISKELEEGYPLNDAIIRSSVQRLRPIVMTTITTIFGLLPLIFSRDVLFYDLAVVVSGGLLIGTVLTLGIIPVLFALFYHSVQVPAKNG